MADRFADKLISAWHGSVSRKSTTGSVLPPTLVCWLALLVLPLCAAEVSPLIVKPNVETRRMGGVNVPRADVLRKMHYSGYILRAAGGKLTKVPVSRVLLPHSDAMNPQGVQVDIGPKGVIYVRQTQVPCKSTDGGHTWKGPMLVCDRGASEGATVRLPSGRLFATIRIGAAVVRPSDPSVLLKYTQKTNSPPFNGRHRVKNLFVTDSDDNGKTWSTARLLTTVFGQPFGYPAVQSDGTVVVIHDTRYGPGPPGHDQPG